jgi:hypothetical protein
MVSPEGTADERFRFLPRLTILLSPDSLAIQVARGKCFRRKSMQPAPECIIKPHPETVSRTEIDDELVQTVSIHISGNEDFGGKRVKLEPGGIIGTLPDSMPRPVVNDELCEAASVHVPGNQRVGKIAWSFSQVAPL